MYRYHDGSFLILGLMLSASVAAGGEFQLDEVAPGIHVHAGAPAALDSSARGDSANIGFIVGERCVAVIDSGGSMETGSSLLRAIRATTSLPICYVINTHVHFDHVLGNAALREADTSFAGHAALAEAMVANRDYFAETFEKELGGPGQQALVLAPDILVEKRLELDLGNRTIELRAVSAAHSTTDLVVHDVRTNTLWTGDLLFRDRMPVLDGSLRGWIAWMDSAMATEYAQVIPGHGPVDNDWPTGAANQARYLNRLLEETRAAVRAGAFIDEAKNTVAVDERERWSLSERAHGLNVSRAFRELEWE